MKKPEYCLNESLTHRPKDAGPDSDMEFHSGTLVFPFWNESLLPNHLKELLKSDQNIVQKTWLNPEKLVLCRIGQVWVTVPISQIRKV